MKVDALGIVAPPIWGFVVDSLGWGLIAGAKKAAVRVT